MFHFFIPVISIILDILDNNKTKPIRGVESHYNISQGQFGYTDPCYPSAVVFIVDHTKQMSGGYKQ